MTALRTLVLVVFLTLVSGTVYLLVRNGAFKSVEIAVEDRGEMILLYKEHIGPYHKIMDDLTAVENAAKTAGLDCTLTFGEYLDDPGLVEQERLHSNVGCVLPSAPAAAPEGTMLKTIPARKYVVGRFGGSPALGPYKVYGKIGERIVEGRMEQTGPVLEIYRPLPDEGMETTYLFPVRAP